MEGVDRELMLWTFNRLCGFNVDEIEKSGIPRKMSNALAREEGRFTKGLCMIYGMIVGIDGK